MGDAVVPLAIFLALGLLAWWGLSRDNPDELPSVYLEQPAPELNLAALRPGEAPPTAADLKTPGIKLVNFWASWCGPCRIEHPQLMAAAAEGIVVMGVNYKDQPEAALKFLAEMGDPYTRIGSDLEGRNGLDWGIYGVPETFVIDAAGKVLLRYPGPITPEIMESRIRPLLR